MNLPLSAAHLGLGLIQGAATTLGAVADVLGAAMHTDRIDSYISPEKLASARLFLKTLAERRLPIDVRRKQLIQQLLPRIAELAVQGIYEESGQPSGWSGSGFFISHQDVLLTGYQPKPGHSYLFTNRHVARKEDITIKVDVKVFGDIGISAAAMLGRRDDIKVFPAVILASDKDHDISMLEIETGDREVSTIPLELDRRKINMGGDVLAFGQPLGLSQTVTKGMISGFEEVTEGVFMLQTDAAINPGNSGGPMVNMAGRVIGINSIKIAEADGVAFAHFLVDQISALRRRIAEQV
ncbi:MAG: trypsin-like peptidase domain-containing protein [Deltaproteobacteria bacterium]|nr:trypsin-like peptidase domain-containing protein [Deltaproteobacteria bacterium]